MEVLRDILHELDDKITPSDLDLMIDEIDADGSGTVDFEGIKLHKRNMENLPHKHEINSLFLFADAKTKTIFQNSWRL